ncbi:DUF2167 domain-containing protein [Profundibacter sp.]
MKRIFMALAVSTALVSPLAAKTLTEMFPDISETYNDEGIKALESLDFKQGKVTVGSNLATIDLADKFYFLDADDAGYVLTTLWGNPPDDSTLGMIFPADKTPLDDTWGIEVSFDDIGYVSDEDAGSYDYDELLKTMQQDMQDENEWRRENNYDTLELLGWAAPPYYDPEGRKLYWAKEIRFDGDETTTLNYNIRILGRKGVLILNFIADMDMLDQVDKAVPTVLEMTNFTDGNRYSDFKPSIDKVAAVGIGGLIAGKVLAKTGLIAVALIFLKKFFFLLLIPLYWLKNLFGRKNS